MNRSFSSPVTSLARRRRSELRASAPADFDEFWRDWGSEVIEIPCFPVSVASETADKAQCILVEFKSLGGISIKAWVSGQGKSFLSPRPLLVTSHGYGGQTDPERVRRLASFGFNVISVDIRGFGLSRGALSCLSPFGWVTTDVLNPETSILRGAVADFVNAYRAGLEWFGQPSKVMFQGFSFAGGLALMSAAVLALTKKHRQNLNLLNPDFLAVGAPTFGDWSQRVQLCQGGSGLEVAEFLGQYPRKRAQIMRSLSFFDSCFFASFLGDETYKAACGKELKLILGVGAVDPIVPAETVYAIYNALESTAELHELPCSHTDWPEERQWVRWEKNWISQLRTHQLIL